MFKIFFMLVCLVSGLFAQPAAASEDSVDLLPLDLNDIPETQKEGNFISLDRHREQMDGLRDSLESEFSSRSSSAKLEDLQQKILMLQDSLKQVEDLMLSAVGDTLVLTKRDTMWFRDTLKVSASRTDTVVLQDTLRVSEVTLDSSCIMNFQALQLEYDRLKGKFSEYRDSLTVILDKPVGNEGPDPAEIQREKQTHAYLEKLNARYDGKFNWIFWRQNVHDRRVIALNEAYMDRYFPKFHSDTLLLFLIDHYLKDDKNIAGMLIKKHLIFFRESPGRDRIENIYLENYAGDPESPSVEDSLMAEYIIADISMDSRAEKYKKYLQSVMSSDDRNKYLRPIFDYRERRQHEYLIMEFQRYEYALPPAAYDEGLFFRYSDWLTEHKYYRLAESVNKKFEIYFPESELLVLTTYRNAVLYRDKMKNYDKALTEFQKIIDEFNDRGMHKKAYRARAEIFRDKTEDMPAAISEFDRLVEQYPKSMEALTALKAIAAIYEEHQKNSDLAIERYEQLQRMFPDSTEQCYLAKISIADLYYADKNWDRSLQAALDIVRTYPDDRRNAEYLFRAAQIKSGQLGNPEDALNIYQETADSWPESKFADKALKAIQKINKDLNKAAENKADESEAGSPDVNNDKSETSDNTIEAETPEESEESNEEGSSGPTPEDP